jgi:hypothetical protein
MAPVEGSHCVPGTFERARLSDSLDTLREVLQTRGNLEEALQTARRAYEVLQADDEDHGKRRTIVEQLEQLVAEQG